MTFLSALLFYLLVFDMFLLIAGLVRPTLVVWWEDIQNRRRVIRIYGRIGLFLGATILIIQFF